jgi:hypothetical protein
LAKLLNFQDQEEGVLEAIAWIKKEFGEDEHEKLFEFLFASFDHFNVYQPLDKKKATADLIKQYNAMYPYDDMKLSEGMQTKILQSRGVQQYF